MSRLTRLHVTAVRYRNASLAPGDERGLDAFAASGAYGSARVPFDVSEPRLREDQRTGVEAEDVGALCGVIADDVSAALSSGASVLMVGGNCSHALGVLGGLEDALGASARIGLAWLDAHADFNTPHTSPSGNLGGMPLAVAAGLAHAGWRERARVTRIIPFSRILMVGCRDVDELEEHLIRGSRVPVVGITGSFRAAADGDRSARTPCAGAALDRAALALAARCDGIYLHVDADVLDDSLTPGHRSAAPDGPGMEDVLHAIDTVMSTGKVAAFAVVSATAEGESTNVTVGSGVELVRGGLTSWSAHGVPDVEAGESRARAPEAR
ncbi:MAG: arginase family protein [Candidatus Eisenbacteria bacterium]